MNNRFPSRRIFHHRAAACMRAVAIGAPLLAGGALSAQICDPSDIFGTPTEIGDLIFGSQIVLGDLNNDGDLDVIAVSFEATNGAVLTNSGEGFFGATGPILIGSSAYVALADFNGDGYLDLVASQYDGARVRVRLNNGDGTFGGSFFYNTGLNPFFVATADFDGDGDEDVAVANYGSDSVSLLMNNGDGVFGAPVNLPVGADPIQLGVGDFDNDGNPDIVVTNYGGSSVSVLRNSGTGIFMPAQTLPTNAFPTPVRIRDLDGDGLADIIVGSPNAVGVLRNMGSFTFAPQVVYPIDQYMQDIAVGDINGDGYADIVGSGSDDMALLINNGDGDFGTGVPVPSFSSFGVALGDMNADGGLDLVVGNYNANVQLHLNVCLIPVNIGQQPVSVAADVGETVQFSVSLSLGSVPVSYQWRRNGTDLEDGGTVSGATADTLTISPVGVSDSDSYDVVVTNGFGSVSSEAAFLAVRSSACPSDFNNDGALNFFDLSAFLQAFNAGCP